ncbi:lambda exonuclease family protein [Devosia elaeis]|uniref:Exonuclease n=1 Tax=Devosia elaeis TaxID=1770058 RepID=A0A178I783_9HYPH|nr:lambda exonuclease family protein [Devosia elaeis]OAM84200.1 exonuclease [Devosia elaeis]
MSEIEQGSADWFAMRLGKVTASRVAEVIAKTKTGYSASRANYAAQLIAERLTGDVAESFSNAAMQWGTEQEPDARLAYEFRHDVEVEQVAFVDHPTIAMSGASPDGLIGIDGLIEIKCPNTATHLDTLRSETIPGKYESQMLWQMACTGRQWCDFASYDPRLPENMRLFVKRLPRDDARIAELEAEVSAFLTEIDATVAELTRKYGLPDAMAA